jgi:hypothetical protein
VGREPGGARECVLLYIARRDSARHSLLRVGIVAFSSRANRTILFSGRLSLPLFLCPRFLRKVGFP